LIFSGRKALHHFMRNLSFSRLKLCFLAGTLEQGGTERQLFYILQALRQLGTAPRLLSLDQGGFWEERIKSLGVSVTWVGGQSSRLKRLFRIVKEVRKDPPDVFQSQHFFTNAYAGVAARLIRAAGIGALRSNGRSDLEESGQLGGWLGLRCPGTIAANSQAAMQYVISRGVPPARLYFLPNVVDTGWYQPAGDTVNEPFTLIALGRVVKEKRLDRFISILHHLRTDYQLDVRGLIVGPSRPNEDLAQKLENQARRLGLLPDFVQFRGGASDTRPAYREAAVCVLTSDYEGTPNVLLEAMASGLPVVASKVGGVPEIVRDGQTGFLIERDNLEGFAAALVKLMKNPGLRTEMGRRARNFVEEYHSLHTLPVYLEGLYQKALSDTRPVNAGIIPNVAIGN
jgi:glycosyltransferase involved in cell wall biosynthesis